MSQSHLGGHTNKCNIDNGLLKWLVSKNCKSFLDVGCGTGGMVKAACDMGMSSNGIEGDKSVEKESSSIVIHDFSTNEALETPIKSYDVVYSCEFLEHITEENFVSSAFEAFVKASKMIVMCAAPPGWGGYHHVNEQGHEYWIRMFNRLGYEHSPDLTSEARTASTMNSHRGIHKQFMKHRCLVFIPKCQTTKSEPYKEKAIINMIAKKQSGLFKSTIPLVKWLEENYG